MILFLLFGVHGDSRVGYLIGQAPLFESYGVFWLTKIFPKKMAIGHCTTRITPREYNQCCSYYYVGAFGRPVGVLFRATFENFSSGQ